MSYGRWQGIKVRTYWQSIYSAIYRYRDTANKYVYTYIYIYLLRHFFLLSANHQKILFYFNVTQNKNVCYPCILQKNWSINVMCKMYIVYLPFTIFTVFHFASHSVNGLSHENSGGYCCISIKSSFQGLGMPS